RVRPFDHVFIEEDGVVVAIRLQMPFQPSPVILLAIPRVLAIAHRNETAFWRGDPIVAEVRDRARELEHDLRRPNRLSWDEVIRALDQALTLPGLAGQLRARYFPRTGLAALLLWLCLRMLGQSHRFGVLLSGADNQTLAANR